MSKTILFVDDSEFTRDIFSFALAGAGFEVHTAKDGLEALEMLQKHEINLLVVDVMMPGMDGYTLTKKVRETPKYKEKPVIIITTQAEAKDKKKGYEAGANVYMIKPVHPEEMIIQIQMFIGKNNK